MDRLAFRIFCSAVAAASLAAAAAAKTYVVNQRHDAASDKNPGTDADPFKTISQAAKVVKAGDTVYVHGGVYRESVTVEADGNAAAPIHFQAAPGEPVVVTGADVLTDLEKVEGPDNIFRAPWPHRFITHNKTFTHPNDDFHLMIGRAEQVFVQGYPLHQVLRRERMSRGTFYVDLAAKQLYVWSRDNRDLADGGVLVEASVRPVIWQSAGDWVGISGLRFRYCANAAQKGAVQVRGRGDWVQDCRFEHANSIGAQFGGEDANGIVVRGCVFQHNGQMGFSAVRAHGLVMTGCLVRDNNTKGYNRGWEAGANKIALCRELVIENSRFLDNASAGIWFDIGNEKCEVRNCLIADNDNAGIFYEISYGLYAHDNVILGNGFGASTGAWGANGGISLSSSPGCWIERNILIGNAEGFQLREQLRSTPNIDDGPGEKAHAIWNRDHVIRNNLIAWNRSWQVGGWFDVLDGRHWPEKMHAGWETAGKKPAVDIAAEYKAKGQPVGVNLGKLNIRFESNLYCIDRPQGLYLWGCTWHKHKTYTDLSAVQRELELEAGSQVARPEFADYSALDLRLPTGHPAFRLKCYPTGEVPGVQLGAIAPPRPTPTKSGSSAKKRTRSPASRF